MKRVICAAGVAAALLVMASTAMAQTAGAPTPSASAPAVNMGYLGGFAGIGAVQNAAAVGGGEAGVRVFHSLDLIVEGGYGKDGVTRRRTDVTATLATLLQNTQGKPASSSVKAPVNYGMVGLRYVIENSSPLRPYVLVEVGRANIEYKPSFTLNGADVTSTLANYGVTLGSDLVSQETKTAFGGGVGVWFVRGPLYVDASVRLLSIQTASQSTNMTRAHVGLGFRF